MARRTARPADHSVQPRPWCGTSATRLTGAALPPCVCLSSADLAAVARRAPALMIELRRRETGCRARQCAGVGPGVPDATRRPERLWECQFFLGVGAAA